MEQGSQTQNDATDSGQEAEGQVPTTHTSGGTSGVENAAGMTFEVWQSRMYYSSHLLCCGLFFFVGLLATLVTKEVHASLLGTMVIAVVMAVILYTAHSATNQVLAHRIVEYSNFAMLAIRLIAGNRVVSEASFEPLEICLQAYGWDILRPVALAVLASTIPIRPLFMVIILFMYAVRLSITIANLMAAANLDSIEDSHTSGWSLYLNSMLPFNVFAMSILAYGMSIRQSRSVHTHMAQLQKALRQEVLANERAIRSEQRAHEAERQVYEDSLQQRNKYLGAMCHDFGTPVAVLQMLLLMMRKRMLQDQKRERQEAAEAAEAAVSGAAGAAKAAGAAGAADAAFALGKALPLASPTAEEDVGRDVTGRKAPSTSFDSTASGSNLGTSRASNPGTSFGANSGARLAATSGASFGASSGARSLECYEDSAQMLDLIRRASAGLELLEVTRQKAIAFSKLQAGGRLVPDRKPFEVAELMRKSASIARDTGKSDRVTVQTHVSGDLPPVVNSDANWLFMVLVNFASNSMKHTRQGSVTISATRVGRLRLRLEVSDTGCGVPAEFVPSLFQPFLSASTTATSVESTGLGLYHSKQLAGILGGKVGYRPTEGGGATFVVEVPMALVSAKKTEEVLAKSQLELGGFEVMGAAPEHGARSGQHRSCVSRAGSSIAQADAPELALAAAEAASKAAATSFSSSAPSAVTATALQKASSIGDSAMSAGHNGGDRPFGPASCAVRRLSPSQDAASHSSLDAARATLHSPNFAELSPPSHSPPPPPPSHSPPSPQPPPPPVVLPSFVPSTPSSPIRPPRTTQATRALTALPTSHHFVPFEPLMLLLSRVPPPLIIDDSELARDVMREQLSAWAGAVPMEAEGGEEALRMLTTEQRPARPSVLLLAVHMAGLNGPATCRAIRKWEQSRGVAQSERLRIVGLLTVSNDAAGRAACLDAGMDDAIVKPFDAAALHSTLHKLLC